MGGRERRQDVTFLALAVAVLAIAVALFVVMRAIPAGRTEPAVEKVEQEATAEPEEAPEPAQKAGRDPFRSQREGAAGPAVATGAVATGAVELKLVGITRREGREPMVTIRSERRHYYVGVGQKAGRYTVASIGANEVVLEGEGGRVTLYLREPEAEEE